MFFDLANALGKFGLGFEGEDGVRVEVVEAEAEGGVVGSESGVWGVVEDVFLDESFGVEWREEIREFLVRVGVWELEFYFYFYLDLVTDF